MREGVISRFGIRLRSRIKAAGFSNISELLRRLGIGHGLVTQLMRRDVGDVGAMKLATIAIMMGVRPSDLMREIDDLLLNPEPLPADLAQALGIPQRPGGHDAARLALVADVVIGWDEEAKAARRPEELGALIDALYADLVAPDPAISMLELRRRTIARLHGIELPGPVPAPRGRGAPTKYSAA